MDAIGSDEALRKFIEYQVKKITETGTLDDRQHPPPPKKVPDDIAKECSTALKSGYFLYLAFESGAQRGQLDLEHPIHLYYTSIKQACEDHPFLKATCASYQVSPSHLLQRMHEVDPNLKYYTVDLKQALTDPQMTVRRLTAQQLLTLHELDPTFLLSIFWIDEFSISFIPTPKNYKIKIYCDSNNVEARHHVVHNPYHSSSQPHVKVRALIIVNALWGPCWIEMMTGTTSVQRVHSNVAGPYKVSQITALQLAVQ